MAVAASRSGDERLIRFAKWYAALQKEAYPKRWKPVYEKFGCTP